LEVVVKGWMGCGANYGEVGAFNVLAICMGSLIFKVLGINQ